MRRGKTLGALLLALPLFSLLGCPEEEKAPEANMMAGKTADAEGPEAPAADGTGAPAPGPAKASKCTPAAGSVCFIGAELEHAVVLIHHITGANVVIAGSYDARIDGTIPVAAAATAFDALAKQAKLAHTVIGNVHYIGSPEVIARGGAGANNFCPTAQSVVAQRTAPQEFAKLAVEAGNKRLQGTIEGEFTIAAKDVNTCVIAQHLVRMGGAQGRVDAKALRIRGEAVLPKSTRAAGTPCAPLDTDKVLRQQCHSNDDLSVVGVGMKGEAGIAIVRRTGRVFEPGEVIAPGEHVGDYHLEVSKVDATGLVGKKGHTIVTWAP